jgi:PIN domain nuclease of toxin-antitoxin system
VLLNETGAQRVATLTQGALLSTVNLSESHGRLLRSGFPENEAWFQIVSLQCEVCPFDQLMARKTAQLLKTTQMLGLSLGDRACLALAIERQGTVYTADRAWKSLALGIEIEVFR